MANKIIQTLLGEPEGYISEADQFLVVLRKDFTQKLSAAQREQVDYMKRIVQLRDGHAETDVKTDLWRNF